MRVPLGRGCAVAAGELIVADEAELRPQQGDLYFYAAAIPHRVTPVEAGVRHTLVLALNDRYAPPIARPAHRLGYWSEVEACFDRIVAAGLAGQSKVHILHGELLEALGRDARTLPRRKCRKVVV